MAANSVMAAAQDAAMSAVEQATSNASSSQSGPSKTSTSTSRRAEKRGKGGASTPASSAGPSRDASPGRSQEKHTVSGTQHSDDDDDDDMEEGEYAGDAGEMSFVFDTAGDMDVDREIALEDGAKTDGADTHVEAGLLLPSHVNVIPQADPSTSLSNGLEQVGGSAEAPADGSGVEGDLGDFEQLDMDPATASRYYGAEEKAERRAKEQCLACGELGHDRRHCPHQHCLACGAMDEHPTRFCPLSTSCFRCGGMGHQTRTCPKPRRGPRSEECERCGSYSHVKALCPTLWRVYAYSTRDDHERFQAKAFFKLESTAGGRDPRKDLEPDGSELSDSEDEFVRAGEPELSAKEFDPATRWCYNCSGAGNHWGDDCPEPRVNPTRGTGEPSAFSEFVSRLGPYGKLVPGAPPLAGFQMPSSQFTFSVGSSATMHVAADGAGNGSRRGGTRQGAPEGKLAIGRHVLSSRDTSRASSPFAGSGGSTAGGSRSDRVVSFDRTQAVEVDGGFLTRKEKRKGKKPLPAELFAQWTRDKHDHPEHADEIRAALERRADLEAKGLDSSGVPTTRDIVGEKKWNRTSRDSRDDSDRPSKKHRADSPNSSDSDSSTGHKGRRRKRRGDGKNSRPHTGWSHSGSAPDAPPPGGSKFSMGGKFASKRPGSSRPKDKRPKHPSSKSGKGSNKGANKSPKRDAAPPQQQPKPRGGGSKYRGSYF